jgi:tungstate transport system substrate-binding protein
MKARLAVTVTAALVVLCGCAGQAERQRVVLGTTHTLEDSGLLDILVAAFTAAEPAYRLSVIVAGSGEILTLAAQGDLDVLLTHSPEDEAMFMASGRGESRHPVMHNDFVLLGPPADPAGAAAAPDVLAALRRIDAAGAPFISRGDGSGTHRRELALRAQAQAEAGGGAYVEAGVGMADLLRLASQRGAYTLADRATYEVLRHQLQLYVVQEGQAGMHNQYSVIVVADARNADGARSFAAWVRGAGMHALLERFGHGHTGRPLFTPDEGSP